MEHVAAELALGHGLDRVARKFRGKQRFELHFLNFSLKLLRALLGAPFQVFDLSLHRGNGLVFFHHFEFQFFFGFFLGLVAFGAQVGLNSLLLLLDRARAWHRPARVALDQLGLRFLRFGELCISLFQNFLKSADFFRFLIKVIAESKLGFLLLFGGDAHALLLKFLRDLLIQGRFGFFERLGAIGRALVRVWSCQRLFAISAVRSRA